MSLLLTLNIFLLFLLIHTSIISIAHFEHLFVCWKKGTLVGNGSNRFFEVLKQEAVIGVYYMLKP